MVGTSMSDEERRAWNRVLGVGFVLVVGGSCALVALASGAGLLGAAVVGAVGLLTGVALAWYLSTLSAEVRRQPRRGN